MTVHLDLQGRFYSAFHYAAKLAIINANKALIRATARKYKDNVYTGDKGEDVSLYDDGDITFANFELENSKTGDVIKFETPEAMQLASGVFAPPPIVGFSLGKNIVTTVIDKTDYEVIESFGCKNWHITIDGLLVDMENHWYPSSLVTKLRAMVMANVTYKVCGQVFDDLGIQELFIDDVRNISFVENYPDTIKFSLSARSIKPAEFYM